MVSAGLCAAAVSIGVMPVHQGIRVGSTETTRKRDRANSGEVVAEGSGGAIITDQVIAYRFQMRGDIGSLTVAFDENFTPKARFAGLVE